MLRIRPLAAAFFVLVSSRAGSAPPPATYLDVGGTRFLTMEWKDGGKVNVLLRTVGGPGSYGRWVGYGQLTPEGVEFTQRVADDAEKGADYLASGSPTRVKVTVKSGGDGGVAGIYRRATPEKVLGLAKKDFEAAEKNLSAAIKLAVRKAPAEDKPVFAEWKQRWPDQRDQVARLTVTRPVAPKPAVEPARSEGKEAPDPGPLEELPDWWLRRAELAMGASAFMGVGVPMGVQPGWEGPYEDGFGGSIMMIPVSNGDVRFSISSNRAEGVAGTLFGKLTAKTLKTGRDGVASGEFTDDNPDVKVNEGEMQARAQIKRIGHILVVETQYAERYAGRSWFDGIYIKRVPPKEE